MSSLQAFRELLSPEDLENVPTGMDENDYLMRFLRFKEDPPRAYETFMKYHKFRNGEKEMFSKMRPSAMKPLLDSKIITKLPGNDAEGRPILLMRYKFWNPKEVSSEDIIVLLILFFEEIIRTHGTSVAIMFDWETYSLAHVRAFTYANIMRSLKLAQGSAPISFKAIHQVNQSTTFQLVSKIFFSLLSTKLKKRIHLHGSDNQSLAAHIPVSSLPVEYGGSSVEDVDNAFMDAMYKNEEYYDKLSEKLRTNVE